jgi:hypothetical protein
MSETIKDQPEQGGNGSQDAIMGDVGAGPDAGSSTVRGALYSSLMNNIQLKLIYFRSSSKKSHRESTSASQQFSSSKD